MQTPEEQKAFFDAQKSALVERARSGGAEAVTRFVESFEDPVAQRVLWFYSRQALMVDPEAGVPLDTCVDVARAAIASFLAQAEAEADEELRARRKDMANVLSYNLSADLADCWDDDGKQRTTAHFEVGLSAALDCIRWREELGKPAGPHSMAWWARGMHELSLGRGSDSVASFERSVAYARDAAGGDAEAFGVVLGIGYLGIARVAAGDAGGAVQLEEALSTFDRQAAAEGDEETKGRAVDAGFGAQQLRTVQRRYVEGSA